VRLVPEGIDPGWQRNPGKLRLQSMEGMLRDRLDGAPEAVQRAAVRDIATSWAAERVLAGKSPAAVPIAALPRGIADRLGSPTRIVRMTSAYGEKFQERGRSVTTETLLVLAGALEGGLIAAERGETLQLHVFPAAGELWHFVLKVMPEAGEIWVNTIHRTTEAKRDAVLRRKGIERLAD
jgi:hypothetical protein